MVDPTKVAQRAIEARKRLHMSRAQVAVAAGVSMGTVINLEQGHLPKVEFLDPIAEVLQIDLGDLLAALIQPAA